MDKPSSPATDEQPLKILIADDTPINLALVSKLLTRKGHSVTQAENGLIAFETFQKEAFDAILMDVQMPIMDGMEATKQIRAYEEKNNTPSQIPIIALTANDEPADREHYLRIGMDYVITKPLNIQTVIPAIRTIIAKKKTGA